MVANLSLRPFFILARGLTTALLNARSPPQKFSHLSELGQNDKLLLTICAFKKIFIYHILILWYYSRQLSSLIKIKVTMNMFLKNQVKTIRFVRIIINLQKIVQKSQTHVRFTIRNYDFMGRNCQR